MAAVARSNRVVEAAGWGGTLHGRAGLLGIEEYVEPRVRRLIADRLGVEADELGWNVSLGDDLAADSLDLLEVAIEIEADLGINLSERRLELVRSYGDLIETVVELVATSRHATMPAANPTVHTRVVTGDGSRKSLERCAELTPYIAQTVTEDVLRAGPGARLEVTVHTQPTQRTLARVRGFFAGLSARGIVVSVQPEQPASTRGRSAA